MSFKLREVFFLWLLFAGFGLSNLPFSINGNGFSTNKCDDVTAKIDQLWSERGSLMYTKGKDKCLKNLNGGFYKGRSEEQIV